MAYICPFCKQRMIHNPDNLESIINEKLIAKNGDTFICDCCFQRGYNSWKFEGMDWFFLDSSKDWILKTKKKEIPHFDFNPSRR